MEVMVTWMCLNDLMSEMRFVGHMPRFVGHMPRSCDWSRAEVM